MRFASRSPPTRGGRGSTVTCDETTRELDAGTQPTLSIAHGWKYPLAYTRAGGANPAPLVSPLRSARWTRRRLEAAGSVPVRATDGAAKAAPHSHGGAGFPGLGELRAWRG